MDWKDHYRRELLRCGTRDRLVGWLTEGADPRIAEGLARGSIVSFPHTMLADAGPLQAAVVSSLLRGRFERVVALGVLHAGPIPAYRVALDEEEASADRARSFEEVRGGFVPDGSAIETSFGRQPIDRPSEGVAPFRVDRHGLLAHEFSLDTFLATLRLAADVFGRPPVPVEPVFVGMTRNPSTGDFSEAHRVAAWLRNVRSPSTALVATGDLVHYGTPYGPLDRSSVGRGALESAFASELRRVLSLAIEAGDLEEAYRRSHRVLRSDQRELLPAIAEALGSDGRFEVVRFLLSDYAGILSVPPPCFVASALAIYG